MKLSEIIIENYVTIIERDNQLIKIFFILSNAQSLQCNEQALGVRFK